MDFDAKRLKKMYNEKFEKGKKVAEQLSKEQEKKRQAAEETLSNKSSGKLVDKLRELAELKKEGLITEEEYIAMKKKLIGTTD